MKLYYYQKEINFGDHLNSWMWERLLPGCFDDPNDGISMTVIGTTIESTVPNSRAVIVFGSGTSYSPPPPDFPGKRWNIVAVRGPLTAKVLNLPADKVVADAAFVIRAFPEAKPVAESKRSGVLFVPHHTTARRGYWQEVCDRAGVEYLDVRGNSFDILAKVKKAKLLLAESLHTGIVGDLVRVPWVPMASSPEINSFKWLDWAATVKVPYKPIRIPGCHFGEAVEQQVMPYLALDHFVQDGTPESVMEAAKKRMNLMKTPGWKTYSKQVNRVVRYGVRPTVRMLEKTSLLDGWTERRLDAAAEVMRKAAQMQGYLSDDKVMIDRSDALLDRIPMVKKIYENLKK